MTQTILVTGATGYIGGRLIPLLVEAGYQVRAMARRPESLHDRPWASEVDIVQGDILDEGSVRAAMVGVDVAFFLVHAMGAGKGFAAAERESAEVFSECAAAAGVRRVVYLGGLHPSDEPLSAHLQSRVEVGEVLLAGPVPAVCFQAAVILGSGSASFEMMRYLAERLPAMIAPKWIHNRIQPIGIRDVLWYLVHSVTLPEGLNRTFDIGGPQVLTYAQMLHRYAAVAGLPRRAIVSVPVLTPRLASHWIGLVTPVPASIAKPLVGSLVHEVVCQESDIAQHISPPADGLMTFERATRHALQRIKDGLVGTSFASAFAEGVAAESMPQDPAWSGGDVFVDERTAPVAAPVSQLWATLEGLGGENGWYSWKLAWQVRGFADRLVGGPGLRRGRRLPDSLRVGDPVDWWRVEQLERGRMLLFRAEMKLPGQAWLELRSDPVSESTSRLGLRAIFVPKGVLGRLYWCAVWPFHGVVFGGMCRNIARASQVNRVMPTGLRQDQAGRGPSTLPR